MLRSWLTVVWNQRKRNMRPNQPELIGVRFRLQSHGTDIGKRKKWPESPAPVKLHTLISEYLSRKRFLELRSHVLARALMLRNFGYRAGICGYFLNFNLLTKDRRWSKDFIVKQPEGRYYEFSGARAKPPTFENSVASSLIIRLTFTPASPNCLCIEMGFIHMTL